MITPFAGRFVVDGGERFVHGDVLGRKLATACAAQLCKRSLRVLAENQPPALHLFFVHLGCHYNSSKLKSDNSSSFFFSFSVSSALKTSLT